MIKQLVLRFMKENVRNYDKIISNRFVNHCVFYERGIFEKQKLRAQAQEKIRQFGVVFPSQEDEEKQIKDMLKMNRLYGFQFFEYLLYDFFNKSLEERLAFVADWEHLGYAIAINGNKNRKIFDNKWNTYNKFKDYYCRDVVYCNKESKKEQFNSFVEKHNSFIIKPTSASAGRGIRVIHAEDKADLFETLMKDYQGSFIVEELICQAEEMKKFHPSSVNTIRVPTIRFDDEVLVIHPFMRMGQKGSCVDNAGSGGILGLIDIESGTVTAAIDELGHRYVEHPDTKEQIIGFQIPRWDELEQLASRLAQVIPENRYTAWDFALTDEGWVMVEANHHGQFGWQLPSQVGFRKEINDIMHRLGCKY